MTPSPSFLLKRLPEDFRVEELLACPLLPEGPYRIYRLTKTGWTTADAVAALAARSRVPADQVRHGGLKDRRGITVQHLSVPTRHRLASPREDLVLEESGYLDRPLAPECLGGNRFRLVVRSLDEAGKTRLEEAVRRGAAGFPNYFDDQRFGSVGLSRAFFAERVLKGHLAGALKLLLTEPLKEDQGPTRTRKARFAALWEDPEACGRIAATPLEGEIFRRLARDRSRRGLIHACEALPRETLSLLFSAYQSFLWNETAGALLRRIPGGAEIPGRAGALYLPPFGGPTPEGSAPTAASRLAPGAPEGEAALLALLEARGVRLPQFNLRHLRAAHFASSLRPLWVRPQGFEASPPEPDDLFPGRWKGTLGFALPRGSYATLLVKTLFLQV